MAGTVYEYVDSRIHQVGAFNLNAESGMVEVDAHMRSAFKVPTELDT